VNYSEAKQLVAKARDAYRGYRLPGREGRTRLVERENGIAIRYTETDVVTIHPDDSVTLNSGGWNSKTTRDRMEYAEPVNVFTDGGVTYVTPKDTYVWAKGKDQSPRVWEFKDGMIFNASGTKCLNAKQLGVRSWTVTEWREHTRSERNRKARERRAERKAEAARELERAARREAIQAEREERERESIGDETPPKVLAEFKATEQRVFVRRTQSELRAMLSVVAGGRS
jgi:hypothetical protein